MVSAEPLSCLAELQKWPKSSRSAQKSYKKISLFFKECIDLLSQGKSIDETILCLIDKREYSYLTLLSEKEKTTSVKDFSTIKKSAVFIREALQKTPKCKICDGLIHRNSISIDHIQRKEDGGVASIENAQLTHPYCNTGYKN